MESLGNDAPASKWWLGWRKTENPEGTAKVDFVTFIVQSYFDTLLRYVSSVTFYGQAVLKFMDQNTLFKLRWGYKVRITLFSKIQLVVYYQCCILIGWATTRLYVIPH